MERQRQVPTDHGLDASASWEAGPALAAPACDHGSAAAHDAAADLAELTKRMRPSEYTAAVLRVIEQRGSGRAAGRAIDIGAGSGVLLAGLARQGAQELWAVDIDPDSLLVAGALLAREAPNKPARLLLSDVWTGVPALAFDAIVANLPHFPAEHVMPDVGRNPHWSGGGRRVLDAFLRGLAAHLTPDGIAWMTHHSLAGLGLTRQLLRMQGLTMRKAFAWTVYESAGRMAAVPPSVLDAADPGELRRVGDYYFAEACVLEIRHRQRKRSAASSHEPRRPGS